MSTHDRGELPKAATVKDSLTVQYDENRCIAELARIEKQLERKKEKR